MQVTKSTDTQEPTQGPVVKIALEARCEVEGEFEAL